MDNRSIFKRCLCRATYDKRRLHRYTLKMKRCFDDVNDCLENGPRLRRRCRW